MESIQSGFVKISSASFTVYQQKLFFIIIQEKEYDFDQSF